ncbi:aa3-type cytochrome c oxidase subunit IV [Microvirga tunisiensis]|uniref:Aa3-type cytochrome c oxidase subunit IV n=3 Tax=Pannonibacter tanglangensis TaxID=2750084 RepID=A0ABW9ZK86_9HYPH|nr:aa3-type cytochrome c oxidase subunit IV [Pannonibacter sp. XCT-34]NBN79738.1 aa3-type cytochrome c oxidase subunit IV [Pannonibacter sp. XCT-53]
MDYAEHERTYEGFINFSKIGTIAVLTVVVILIMFAFGGTSAVVFGWILMIANLLSIAAGMAMGDKGWIPATAVFVLSGLLAFVTV